MGGTKKQTTTQTYTPPDYIQEGAETAVGIGQRIAQTEYKPFVGQRVAPLSRNEELGMERAGTTSGKIQPYINASQEFANRGTQQFADANIDSYMNPFIKGALDPVAREIREEGAREGQRLQGMQASMGAFGGSRGALMEAENREKTIQGISDVYGQGFAAAYESAVGIWGDERARDMQASGRLLELGDAVGRANELDISTLMATGATDRSIQQAMADFDFEQFITKRDWDFRQLGGILAALEGTKGSYETTTTSVTSTKKGKWAAILGVLGAVIGGIYGGGMGASAGASAGSGIGGAIDG